MTATELATKTADYICQGHDRVRLGEPNPFNGSQPGWCKQVLRDLIEEAIRTREAELMLQFGPRMTLLCK